MDKMSRLDLVIFGATGFTGKKAVEQLAKGGKEYDGVTWGVAGRSQSKLELLMAEMAKLAGKDLSSVKIIIADVSDEESLKDMCSQAKVIVNCCGPYRLYGEPVVRAAVEAKTHYVDISGEQQFIESMQLKYDAQAQEAGVYIISACGFDSIPNDMGVIFLQQSMGGIVNSVESYLSLNIRPEHRNEAYKSGAINYGTWESLVYVLSHFDEVGQLRKKMYPEKLPTFKPSLRQRFVLHKMGGCWCMPFLGADESIVYRTQRTIYESAGERPVQFKAYVKLSNLFYSVLAVLSGVLLFLMANIKYTRQLLLSHPSIVTGGLVTRQGPSEEVINNSQFSFELVGKGWAKGEHVENTKPTKTTVVRVSGVNPAYGATLFTLLHSALTVLREQDKMPAKRGVMTTGVAFRNTTLIQRLNQTKDIKFEVLETK